MQFIFGSFFFGYLCRHYYCAYISVLSIISSACRIKKDDKLIQAEGVESLSEDELREDCRERGMLGFNSVEEMRQQVLEQNLKLHFLNLTNL